MHDYVTRETFSQTSVTFLLFSSDNLECKAVVFLANASDKDGPSSNERSGARVKTVRENGKQPKTTVLQSTDNSFRLSCLGNFSMIKFAICILKARLSCEIFLSDVIMHRGY